MNNGIFSTKSYGVDIDNGTIKPLLGTPQTIPLTYCFPKSYDLTFGNSNANEADHVIVIDTTKGNNTSVSMLLTYNAGGRIDIDWGDGTNGFFIPSTVGTIRRAGSFETSIEFIGGATLLNFAAIHTYAKHGIYLIRFKGQFQTAFNSIAIPNIATNTIYILSYGTNSRLTALSHAGMRELIYVPPVLPPSTSSISFQNCVNFNHPNVSYWNTSGVTSIASIFNGCSLFNQNIGSWNTSAVSNMNRAFFNAINFEGLNISNWNTISVTNMGDMFQNATNFSKNLSLNLSNWVVSGVTAMTNMFNGCSNLTNCTISGWSATSGCSHSTQFAAANISGSYLPNWSFKGSNNCNSMFQATNMANVSGLDSWDVSGITNGTYMFFLATNVGTLNIPNWKFGTADLDSMFRDCQFNGNVSGWDVSKVTNMSSMFLGNSAFKGSGLENWNLAGLSTSSALTNFANNATFTTTQYDLILNSWNANKSSGVNGVRDWPTGLSPNFGSSKYTAAGSGARAALLAYNWNISDGGLQI